MTQMKIKILFVNLASVVRFLCRVRNYIIVMFDFREKIPVYLLKVSVD